MDGNGCFDGQRDATVEWAAAHPSLAPDATQNLAALRAGQTIWGGWNMASIRFFTQVRLSRAVLVRPLRITLHARVRLCTVSAALRPGVSGVLPASCSWKCS